MTCIVGLVDNGKVWMGGDSAGVAGLDITVRSDPKVFINGEFLIGFTTSFRMGQLLAHAFKPPRRHPDTDLYAYMVTDFVDALRTCFNRGGFNEVRNGADKGGSFLVGHQGQLFSIHSDYQVGIPTIGFDAAGCGEAFALGAMRSNEGLVDPEVRVRQALETAEHFSGGVRSPFVIKSI